VTSTSGSGASADSVLGGAGDKASYINDNDESTAKVLDRMPSTVFTAGVNAYVSGTSSEFKNSYDPT
jgi:acid phosphatase type 7